MKKLANEFLNFWEFFVWCSHTKTNEEYISRHFHEMARAVLTELPTSDCAAIVNWHSRFSGLFELDSRNCSFLFYISPFALVVIDRVMLN